MAHDDLPAEAVETMTTVQAAAVARTTAPAEGNTMCKKKFMMIIEGV